jgi:CRP-like cAMP-binding protein
MENNALWYLENIDVTNIFCPNKLSTSTSVHPNIKVAKGEAIYLPNDKSGSIYFISKGSVKIVSQGEEDKEITKAILEKGEVFGELAIFGEEKRRDSAIATEDTELCVTDVNNLKDLMRDHSNISLFFMNLLGSKLLKMEKRLESLVFRDSKTRVVEYLIHLVETKGSRVGFEFVVRGFSTHQEIANFTATSRQTVTTLLNDLRKRNILTFNRKNLLVRDLELLKSAI